MENRKQVGASSSSSSFTTDLFGPKNSSSSSTTLFGSVFGPSSTGLRKPESGSQVYGSGKHGNPDYMTQRNKGETGGTDSKDPSCIYQNERGEPSYLGSSIYYGGQEVYPPNSQTATCQHIFKKNGEDDDPNGNNPNSASRGNWWQGSLYY